MTDRKSVAEDCWGRVISARNEFFSFQEALLEIASPSKVEGVEQDARKRLSIRLMESVGHRDVPEDLALGIFDVAERIFSKLGASRETLPEAPSSEVEKFVAEDVLELVRLLKSAGISEDLFTQCLGQFQNISSRARPRSSIILESSLISAVSSFESFISRLISASLRFNPNPLKASDRKFEYKDIANLSSIDDFVQDAIEKYADNLMRDPLEKWIGFLSTAMPRNDFAWIVKDLNEIFQRRHVHVHNGGRVSRAYLDNLLNELNPPALHDHLSVSIEYLGEALDKLASIVLYLSQAALHAIRNVCVTSGIDGDYSDQSTNQVAFDLLVDRRYRAIHQLFPMLDPLFWTSITREYFRANCFQSRKNLYGIDSIRAEITAWDVSLNPMIKLAKLCILEKLDEAQSVLDQLLREEQISLIQVATWPILEPLRRV